MRETVTRLQSSVFGRFNFPPTPDTTISLLNHFRTHQLMPSVIQGLDVATGVLQPRIVMRDNDSLLIQFSNERIDIMETLPSTDADLDAFAARVRALLACLIPMNLHFSRVSLVREVVVREIPANSLALFASRVLTHATENTFEWSGRWIHRDTRSAEHLNVCLEVARMTGVIATRDQSEPFDGIKYLHDISTTPDNTNARFTPENIQEIFNRIFVAYGEQTTLLNTILAVDQE